MEKKELKPAFPNPAFGVAHFGQGMTLRDWFAGMALQGYLSGYLGMEVKNNSSAESIIGTIGFLSYALADAMLVERDDNLQSTQGKEDREKTS